LSDRVAAVHELRIATRWTDFDALGHLTHAAYPVLLDEARDALLTAVVGPFTDWPTVIVQLSVDFHHEIRPPAPTLTVRTRVVAVGRTSVTFEQEVLAPDGAVAASARAVVVAWDPETRAAREIAVGDRAALET
jgi:YbgC/YbaW family acyl-CoA thioester hydrolase